MGLLFFASTTAAQPNDPCRILYLRPAAVQGMKILSPDGRRYLVKKEDRKGTAQIYVGETAGGDMRCITCRQQPGGPKPARFKMQPTWHPSGNWIFMAVERDEYAAPPLLGWNRQLVEGWLECGLWTNMYAVTPDGVEWHRLTNFKSNVKGVADGYTGPAFTPDGKTAVWSQIVDGNVFKYKPFGKWQMIAADVVLGEGGPRFENLRDITPPGMHWNEPGNFAPDNVSLLFSGSDQEDAQGQDQFVLNIETGALRNLNNTPTVWDEHGIFSPDGRKILFMSAWPYRKDPDASKVLSIKTEFMLMDADGGNMQQLTRFKTKGYPESGEGIAAVGGWSADGKTLQLAQLFFPDYKYWELGFAGPCGASP
ncbi:MAG TPA: hypothetical protein VEF76_07590 [Patescibacteria group bacterium]|nr:hypothetical protein [Patescibacteria group bacterium]